ASAAITVNAKRPGAVGVPVNMPALDSDNPVGSDPPITANVALPTPPACVMVVEEYGTPVVPLDNDAGDSAIVGHRSLGRSRPIHATAESLVPAGRAGVGVMPETHTLLSVKSIAAL